MNRIFGRIASLFSRQRNEGAEWPRLPAWTKGPTEIQVPHYASIATYEHALIGHDRSSVGTLRQINMSGIYSVNLADNSCTCSEWQQVKKGMPAHDVRRVCKHIVKAILHRKGDFDGQWNEWTLRILHAIDGGVSHGVFTSYTHAFFDNGNERFLALYDNSRGYVELFSENGGCFGYDSSGNRWAHGVGPEKPSILKRALRPWIESLDARFKNGKFHLEE